MNGGTVDGCSGTSAGNPVVCNGAFNIIGTVRDSTIRICHVAAKGRILDFQGTLHNTKVELRSSEFHQVNFRALASGSHVAVVDLTALMIDAKGTILGSTLHVNDSSLSMTHMTAPTNTLATNVLFRGDIHVTSSVVIARCDTMVRTTAMAYAVAILGGTLKGSLTAIDNTVSLHSKDANTGMVYVTATDAGQLAIAGNTINVSSALNFFCALVLSAKGGTTVLSNSSATVKWREGAAAPSGAFGIYISAAVEAPQEAEWAVRNLTFDSTALGLIILLVRTWTSSATAPMTTLSVSGCNVSSHTTASTAIDNTFLFVGHVQTLVFDAPMTIDVDWNTFDYSAPRKVTAGSGALVRNHATMNSVHSFSCRHNTITVDANKGFLFVHLSPLTTTDGLVIKHNFFNLTTEEYAYGVSMLKLFGSISFENNTGIVSGFSTCHCFSIDESINAADLVLLENNTLLSANSFTLGVRNLTVVRIALLHDVHTFRASKNTITSTSRIYDAGAISVRASRNLTNFLVQDNTFTIEAFFIGTGVLFGGHGLTVDVRNVFIANNHFDVKGENGHVAAIIFGATFTSASTPVVQGGTMNVVGGRTVAALDVQSPQVGCLITLQQVGSINVTAAMVNGTAAVISTVALSDFAALFLRDVPQLSVNGTSIAALVHVNGDVANSASGFITRNVTGTITATGLTSATSVVPVDTHAAGLYVEGSVDNVKLIELSDADLTLRATTGPVAVIRIAGRSANIGATVVQRSVLTMEVAETEVTPQPHLLPVEGTASLVITTVSCLLGVASLVQAVTLHDSVMTISGPNVSTAALFAGNKLLRLGVVSVRNVTANVTARNAAIVAMNGGVINTTVSGLRGHVTATAPDGNGTMMPVVGKDTLPAWLPMQPVALLEDSLFTITAAPPNTTGGSVALSFLDFGSPSVPLRVARTSVTFGGLDHAQPPVGYHFGGGAASFTHLVLEQNTFAADPPSDYRRLRYMRLLSRAPTPGGTLRVTCDRVMGGGDVSAGTIAGGIVDAVGKGAPPPPGFAISVDRCTATPSMSVIPTRTPSATQNPTATVSGTGTHTSQLSASLTPSEFTRGSTATVSESGTHTSEVTASVTTSLEVTPSARQTPTAGARPSNSSTVTHNGTLSMGATPTRTPTRGSPTASVSLKRPIPPCRLLNMTIAPPRLSAKDWATKPLTLTIGFAPASTGRWTLQAAAATPLAGLTVVDNGGTEGAHSLQDQLASAPLIVTAYAVPDAHRVQLRLTLAQLPGLMVYSSSAAVSVVISRAALECTTDPIALTVPVAPYVDAASAAAKDSSIAAGAAAVGGASIGAASAAAELQTIAALGLMRCGSADDAATRSTPWLLGPVNIGGGSAGALIGNFVLLIAFTALMLLLCGALMLMRRHKAEKEARKEAQRVKDDTDEGADDDSAGRDATDKGAGHSGPWEPGPTEWRSVFGTARFPSLQFSALQLAYPGITAHSFVLLFRGDFHPVAVVGAAIALGMPAVIYAMARRFAAPRFEDGPDCLQFFKYTEVGRSGWAPQRKTGLWWAIFGLLTPAGRWGPTHVVRRLGGPFRAYFPIWAPLFAPEPWLTACASSFVIALPLPHGFWCGFQFGLLMLVSLIGPAVALLVSPYRTKALLLLRLLAALLLLFMLVVSAGLAMEPGDEQPSDTYLLLLSVGSSFQTVLTVIRVSYTSGLKVAEMCFWNEDARAHPWVDGASIAYAAEDHNAACRVTLLASPPLLLSDDRRDSILLPPVTIEPGLYDEDASDASDDTDDIIMANALLPPPSPGAASATVSLISTPPTAPLPPPMAAPSITPTPVASPPPAPPPPPPPPPPLPVRAARPPEDGYDTDDAVQADAVLRTARKQRHTFANRGQARDVQRFHDADAFATALADYQVWRARPFRPRSEPKKAAPPKEKVGELDMDIDMDLL